MDFLYVCNTGSDYISKISLDKLSNHKIPLNIRNGRVGPHGLCSWKSDIIVANSYSNSISKINILEDKETANYYIGVHCNDVRVLNNLAYIVCGESNSIVVFDLLTNKIIQEIPCGNMPHSIFISKETGLAVISNMQSDSVSIFDCINNDMVATINVGPYPTKALVSEDNNYLIICESNMGVDKEGTISIYNFKTLKKIKSITVDRGPVDLWYDYKNQITFVSNFIDGTISFVDMNELTVFNSIKIGGMPRGIVKKQRLLYIGDNYSNKLYIHDIFSQKNKVIPLGKEPTGMTLV